METIIQFVVKRKDHFVSLTTSQTIEEAIADIDYYEKKWPKIEFEIQKITTTIEVIDHKNNNNCLHQ